MLSKALLRFLSLARLRREIKGEGEGERGEKEEESRRGGEKKEGKKASLHRGWFAKGCRPCLCVLLTRCTSILSACLRKLISIAAETGLRNESIGTAIFSTPPPNGGNRWLIDQQRTIFRSSKVFKIEVGSRHQGDEIDECLFVSTIAG